MHLTCSIYHYIFLKILIFCINFLNICCDILNICFPSMRMVPTSDTSTWAPTVYSFAVPLTSSVSFLHFSISSNRALYLQIILFLSTELGICKLFYFLYLPRLSFYFSRLSLLGLNFLIVCNTY